MKKGISPVVATALLLIVAVVAVIGFQNWFGIYSSDLFVQTEKGSSSTSNTNIETLVDDQLYFKNTLDNNISIKQIKIGNKECNISINLTKGVHNISLGNCVKNLTSQVNDITVITDKQIYTKKHLFKDATISSSTILVPEVIRTWFEDWNGSNNGEFEIIEPSDTGYPTTIRINENKILYAYVKLHDIYVRVGIINETNITLNSSNLIYDGSNSYSTQLALLEENKVLLTYRESGTGYANVLTINENNSISIGPQFTYGNDLISSVITFPISSTKVLATYRASGNPGKAFIFEITGTTISKGTTYQFSPYGATTGVQTINSTTGIISYIGNHGGGYFPYLIVTQISGTDLTFGSPTRIDSSGNSERFPMGFSQTNKNLIILSSSYVEGPSNAQILNITGTTINILNTTQIHNNGTYNYINSIPLTENDYFISYTNLGGDEFEYGKILRINGTQMNYSSPVKITNEKNFQIAQLTLINNERIINTYLTPTWAMKTNVIKK